MNQLLAIVRKEFGDRLRSGWVLAYALVWLGAVTFTSLFGLVQIGKIGVQGYDRTVVSLLSLVQYLVPLLGLLLGHDLLVTEREDKTLMLIVAGGVSRRLLLLAKFLGGCLTLAFPLTLGFALAGTAIGLAAGQAGLGPFLKLAGSGLVLGIIFLGIGLGISTLMRTRVQALVCALLAWCAAVFVFDLIAMGVLVVTHSAQSVREVETTTDATHVNTSADLHAAFENGDDTAASVTAKMSKPAIGWLLVNPVDLFRAVNLPKDLAPAVPWTAAMLAVACWLLACLGAGIWKLNRLDL
jgi:Cu-processing system permease protein